MRLRPVLTAACLLAGVFAMHGLSAGHEPVAAHSPMAVEHGHPPAAVQVAPGADHSMGELCLAVLTALGLAIVAAQALRSLRISRPVVPAGSVLAVPTTGRAPPWLPVSSTKLCVLRT
jgi:hypothetical protein